MTEYQKRSAERLIAILRSSSTGSRSWQEEAADEIERLRAIAMRAQLAVNEWHAYGGVKEPIADQLEALEELLSAEQKADGT